MSKRWKAKFFILWDGIFLVRLLRKFWNWSAPLLVVKGRIDARERTVGAGDCEFVPVVLWLKHKRRQRRWYAAYQVFLQSLPQGFHPHRLPLGHRSLNRLFTNVTDRLDKKQKYEIFLLSSRWSSTNRTIVWAVPIVRSARISAPAGVYSGTFSATSKCHTNNGAKWNSVTLRQLQGAEFPS